MAEYRISELAERSGFPATTLRFYEQVGLLPAARSPAGYRRYTDDALERLRFIAAGKGLGLALEEISELLAVWERGVCAEVRTSLRPLVAGRIRDAEHQIAELSVFVAALTGVHDDLGGAAPDGPCAPGCGCVGADPPGPVHVELGRSTRPPPPIMCTLDGDEQVGRRGEWAALLAAATAREHRTGVVRLSFPPGAELAGRLARLAAAEQACCAFFEFTLDFTATALVLTVTAPAAAEPVLIDLFGANS